MLIFLQFWKKYLADPSRTHAFYEMQGITQDNAEVTATLQASYLNQLKT